jgi:YVTN family beta-propeller protein
MPDLPSGTVTFLFTDIEGSTDLVKRLGGRYQEVHAEHQRILRTAFTAHGGHEVDTQGDSFFVAFRRAKDAVAAAVAAQRDVAAHAWPDGADVKVRMGLHTGEPHVGEDRYVGLGVHKAARIGAAGHGGQVLLSRTTRELVEDELPSGVTIRDLGERRLKDLERPEQLSQLVIQGLPSEFGPLQTLDVELRRRRRRMYAGAALIGVLAAAVAIPVFALGQRSGGGGATVEPNSVAVIDPNAERVIDDVTVGIRPSAIAAGDSSIWVANLDDRSLSRIDPASRTVLRTISLDATPTGVAAGTDAVWLANGLLGSVSRVDPSTNYVTATTDVTQRSSSGSVAAAPGAVWAVFGNSVLGRINPRTNVLVPPEGIVGGSPSAIAIGEGGVWVANSSDNTVSRILPETATAVKTVTVGRQPRGVAVGAGALWVTDSGDDYVTRIDPRSYSTETITVGDGPTGIAYGEGAIWVANANDGTVSKIDPIEKKVVATITVGGRPVGVTVSDGRVWVTVQSVA